MQKKFTKVNTPLVVGSIVRHSGNAGRFMEVIDITGNVVTQRSYGRGWYGTWTYSVRPVTIKTTLGQQAHTYYGLKLLPGCYSTADSGMFGKGAGYDYYHVVEIPAPTMAEICKI